MTFTLLGVATVLALARAAYGSQTPYEGHVLTTFAGQWICTFIAVCWWQLVVLGIFKAIASRAGGTTRQS
jgi:hypothetical protein